MSDTPARARQALYTSLIGAIGSEHADTLMTYLPSHPAEEAATKADIQEAVRDLKADIARLDERVDRLEHRMDRLEDRMDRLEDRMDRLEDRMDRLEDRFDWLGGKIDGWQRTTLIVIVSAMTGLTAIFSAVMLLVWRLGA